VVASIPEAPKAPRAWKVRPSGLGAA